MITETFVVQVVVGLLVFIGVTLVVHGMFIWILDDLLRWVEKLWKK